MKRMEMSFLCRILECGICQHTETDFYPRLKKHYQVAHKKEQGLEPSDLQREFEFFEIGHLSVEVNRESGKCYLLT